MNYDTKVETLPGIGDKTAIKLKKLGIETLLDLMWNFPRKYEDFTDICNISEIGNQVSSIRYQEAKKDIFTVKGSILGIGNKTTRRRGFVVTEGVVTDNTGSIKVVWFNQPYLGKMLKVGSEMILHGKVTFDPFVKTYVMESPVRSNRPKIVPIYSETVGLSTYFIQKLFEKYKFLVSEIEEYLPERLLVNQLTVDQLVSKKQSTSQPVNQSPGLLSLHEALLNIHEPKNAVLLQAAQRRFAFEELFLISLRANVAKAERGREKGEKIVADRVRIDDFIKTLPFGLTGDQKKAIDDILNDLQKVVPMNRLLNGDVGSGKTIVAVIAAFAVKEAGMKTLIMAPTEILANQHFQTFCRVFKNYDVSIGLMTSDRKESNQESQNNNQETRNIESKKAQDSTFKIQDSDIIIGTHALIQKSGDFNNVGLVVVDEQHRFGVKQREAIAKISNSTEIPPLTPPNLKGEKEDALLKNSPLKLGGVRVGIARPHFLSMTATPIPRTLQLALFGDLDISVISEKPANRKEIKTRFVETWNREKAYDFIKAHLKAGRQAFVICPLIEEQDQDINPKIQETSLFEEDRKSVKAENEKLQKVFPEFKIGMLHGKMKAKEKNEVMELFKNNELNLLVSTSVVEVGVDVPNASVMIIEDAERFGLAQIHQFRGRVGRGEHQSFCFLFSNTQSETALERLRGLENISNGFELAELDLKMRGPGAIFGTEQSGILDLKFASFSDRSLIEEAAKAAKEIAPEIDKYPKLKEKVSNYSTNKHIE